MLNRILIGAVAGAIATGPQSAAIWGLRRAGVYRRTAPPELVAETVTDRLIGMKNVPERLVTPIVIAEHVGFGAAGGAVFGLLTGVIRPTIAAGVLAGLAIWKLSYEGWIPALKIMPPADEDEEGRQVALIVAHVVYGAVLGAIVDKLTTRA